VPPPEAPFELRYPPAPPPPPPPLELPPPPPPPMIRKSIGNCVAGVGSVALKSLYLIKDFIPPESRIFATNGIRKSPLLKYGN
jgi:hypothetical protein